MKNDHITPGNHKVWEVNESARCPFMGGALDKTAGSGTSNRDWWPNMLNLTILRQHSNFSAIFLFDWPKKEPGFIKVGIVWPAVQWCKAL